MNKNELIQNTATRLKLSRKEARLLYDATLEELSSLLMEGGSVNIPGFGTFSVSKLEKRKGFNPLMEQWMMLPPRMKPHFKPGETLKRRVNPS